MPVESPPSSAFSKQRFLIVDDFDGMRNILGELLRRCGGHQIDMAANAEEALTALSRNKYDVVLCDYHLGPGRNGQQVLEEARARNLLGLSSIWAMITAEKTSDMVMGAAEHQPDDYLVKPLTEAMLQTRLTRIAARKSTLFAIESAVRAKEYPKAIQLCDQRLKEDQANDAHVQRLRCEMLVLTGNFTEAKASFESLLALRDFPWAMAGLAKLCFRDGHYARAKTLLGQVLEGNRAFLEGYDWMARTLIQLGEWQAAQEMLVRAATLLPHSLSRQKSLGTLARHCGEELMSKLHSGSHDLPPCGTLELAETLMQLGNKDVGSRLIQFVVRNHHEDESLLRRAQGIFDQAQMTEEGAGILASTRQATIETMDKGVRLAAQGKLDEGIDVMRLARTLMPNNPRLLLNLAYLLITQMEKSSKHPDNFQEARRCIDSARKSNADPQRCGQLQARLEKLA